MRLVSRLSPFLLLPLIAAIVIGIGLLTIWHWPAGLVALAALAILVTRV